MKHYRLHSSDLISCILSHQIQSCYQKTKGQNFPKMKPHFNPKGTFFLEQEMNTREGMQAKKSCRRWKSSLHPTKKSKNLRIQTLTLTLDTRVPQNNIRKREWWKKYPRGSEEDLGGDHEVQLMVVQILSRVLHILKPPTFQIFHVSFPNGRLRQQTRLRRLRSVSWLIGEMDKSITPRTRGRT